MATVYKIHPAIGVARVGNSPDEYFLGPERVGAVPEAAGGFKDAQCRIKRQGARFRIYAHHDDGTVQEITDADAEISWTVEIANTKADHPKRGNKPLGNTTPMPALRIEPGPRTLTGPNESQVFDTGTIAFQDAPVTGVQLGEIRSTPENRLVVLGGVGTSASPNGNGLNGDFWANAGWYDDVSDGPVQATIKLRADGSTPPVAGAWVLVAPPKFTPSQDAIVTLYDRVLEAMVKNNLVAEDTTTSYTRDIHPILQRARDTRGVEWVPGDDHAWPEPVVDTSSRDHIFDWLKAPDGSGGGSMPAINDSGTSDNRLTTVQYQHFARWHAGDFVNDWAGPPAPQADVTPDGLDRAALEACVGAAFFPGIETGGLPDTARPIIDPANYAEPFRLDHAKVSPGDLTSVMALPWQNDFYQCSDNWWPVPRPNYVKRGDESASQVFTADVADSAEEMIENWHRLGFVVRQGVELREVDRCDRPSINLLTPTLDFHHVPQGPMGTVRETALSITFEVVSPSASVTLAYAPGGGPKHPQLTAYNSSVTVGPTSAYGVATARLWVIFRTAAVGSVLPPQILTVQNSDGTSSWTVVVTGDTVARNTAAVALVLDRSASMSEPAGAGVTKQALLQQAATSFVELMLEGDGVGLVRFNQDADVLENVIALGDNDAADINRAKVKDRLGGPDLTPDGSTSIGDGIAAGHAILGAASGGFDTRSLVIFTDGKETAPKWISDVADTIDDHTYAVGLGQPHNISVSALQTLSGNNGGYLLVTGPLGSDNRFMLQKYFLQVLAGISNAEVVLDPDGDLFPGQIVRVPFHLTAADAGVDVVLVSPDVRVVDFRVQTPSGQLIEPWRASSDPGMRYVLGDGISCYRLALPIEFASRRHDWGGVWHAVLTLGRPRTKRGDTADGTDATIRRTRPRDSSSLTGPIQFGDRPAAAPSWSIPYSVLVHAYSNLTLRAHVEQREFRPGSAVSVSASLTQSGLPLLAAAHLWAEIRPPRSQSYTLQLDPVGDWYRGKFAAAEPGVYAVRIRARGRTRTGETFTREKTLTAALWRGDDASGVVTGRTQRGPAGTVGTSP